MQRRSRPNPLGNVWYRSPPLQYKPDTFERLAHSATIEKLVSVFGYPPELHDLTFDWRYMMRGLIIDKVRLCSMCRGARYEACRGA